MEEKSVNQQEEVSRFPASSKAQFDQWVEREILARYELWCAELTCAPWDQSSLIVMELAPLIKEATEYKIDANKLLDQCFGLLTINTHQEEIGISPWNVTVIDEIETTAAHECARAAADKATAKSVET